VLKLLFVVALLFANALFWCCSIVHSAMVLCVVPWCCFLCCGIVAGAIALCIMSYVAPCAASSSMSWLWLLLCSIDTPKKITTVNLYGIGQSMMIVVSLVVALFPWFFAAVMVVLASEKTINLCDLGGILVWPCFLQ